MHHIDQARGVAGFVVPGLKVRDLNTADAEQDPQNFRAGHSLRENGIQTGAALLEEGKVKTGGIRDGLREV